MNTIVLIFQLEEEIFNNILNKQEYFTIIMNELVYNNANFLASSRITLLLTTYNTYLDKHMFILISMELSLIIIKWIGLPFKHFMAIFNDGYSKTTTSTNMDLVQDIGMEIFYMHQLIYVITVIVTL